jgi:hypothetical protein
MEKKDFKAFRDTATEVAQENLENLAFSKHSQISLLQTQAADLFLLV